MIFLRRLKFYVIGVAIGLVMVFFFYKDREFDAWLPEGRVLEQIERNELTLTNYSKCQMECLNITEKEIKELLNKGKVDFSESQTRKKPCPIYLISLPNKLMIELELCEKKSKLVNIGQEVSSCNCDVSSN